MSIAKACYTKRNKKASAQYYCRTTVDLEKGKVLLRERQTAEKSSEFPSVHMFYLGAVHKVRHALRGRGGLPKGEISL